MYYRCQLWPHHGIPVRRTVRVNQIDAFGRMGGIHEGAIWWQPYATTAKVGKLSTKSHLCRAENQTGLLAPINECGCASLKHRKLIQRALKGVDFLKLKNAHNKHVLVKLIRQQLLCSLCHFYLLDSVCYQYRGAKIKYLRLSAKQCEAENHCYNYKNNKCYDVL